MASDRGLRYRCRCDGRCGTRRFLYRRSAGRDNCLGRRGRSGRDSDDRGRSWFEALDLENPFHGQESNHQDDDSDEKGKERPAPPPPPPLRGRTTA